nr:M23/M56 family metallopeptidase [uncultured Oscillibacter sp.]
MSLLERSLTGAPLILVIAALRALTRERLPKRTFVALWWVAAARLLTPVALPSRFSVYTLLAGLRHTPARVPKGTGTPIQVIPGTAPSVVAETAPRSAASFPVWTALWLAGMALLAAWFAVTYVRSQRRFRASLPVEGGFAAAWAAAHRRVAVRVSDQISAPLTYGLLRPVILLPKHMDWEDEAALTHILTHESIHIRRLDGVTKLLLAAVLCVHWFNPAVWLLYVLANRDIELACDEAVVRLLGQPGAYARTLLRMEETKAGCRPLYSHFSENAIEERIKAIMNMKLKKTSVPALACALLLIGSVTTVFATSAQAEPAPERTPLERLEESIVCLDGRLSFTIPEDDIPWSIWIGGRVEADGMGMSVHYLEEESAAGGWEPGKTYSFDAADGPYESLCMAVFAGGEEKEIDLLVCLPRLEGAAAPAEGTAALSWPVQEGGTISQSFGSRANPGGQAALHSGIDIASVEGGVILAAADGTVAETGYNASAGNYLVLDHGNGLETFYAHCRDFTVGEGDAVNAGGMIGAVGSTGMSTGPHLHFEVRQDGEAQDPLGYFSEETLAQIGSLW